MASKVIGFRVPEDLAKLFEQFCEAAGKTSGEVLRNLVDDLIYPPGAELDSPERLYGVGATEQIAELVNTQIKEQIGGLVDEHLKLVQIDRGLTEAEKEHYDGALTELESGLANLKVGVNKMVQTVNSNVEVCNEEFVKVARLFQFLAAHIHDGDGAVVVSPKELLAAEVKLADKRAGKIEGQPLTIQGKTALPGYKHLEHLNLSVRKDRK